MKNTEKTQVVAELARIQGELKAPKGQMNKFGGYRYRSTEDILEGLKKVKGGCAVTIQDEIVEIAGRVYVKATATLIAPDGSTASCNAYAREAESKKGMDDAQVTGATSSYARKYALNGLFAIDDTKDADATNDGKDEPEKPATTKQRDEVLAQCADLDVEMDTFYQYLGCKGLDDMTESQYRKAVVALKKKAKQKGVA